MNYIRQLGAVAIASRLRALNDVLVRDAVRIYEEQEVDFEPRWFPLVMLLKEKGPLSVMEIAEQLNMTHPAVNQTCNILEKKGHIRSLKDKKDKRKRIIHLNDQCIQLTEQLEPLWKHFESAVTDLFYETQADFLDILSEMEEALDRKSMYERIREQVRQSEYDSIEIINYQPEYGRKFLELNYEWLNEYFEVEEEDDRLLKNPDGVIADGGTIIFGAWNGTIVGTVALLHLSDEECELTKMAVTNKYQNKQIGKKMMDYVLDIARQKNYQRMILLTNPVLRKAVGLYKSKGFRTTIPVPTQLGALKRLSIKMELTLSLTSKIFKA